MKGMELPINMIVVVLIAVLVLVTVSVFLGGQLGGGTGSISLEAAYSKGCQQFRDPNLPYNCQTSQMSFQVKGYRLPGSATDATFAQICEAKSYDTDSCARSCGCQLP